MPSQSVPPDSAADRHTDEPRGQPAAPWADPPSEAGRSQPPHQGGNGYGHGPAVGVAIDSAAGLTAATAHLPIVPGPRGNRAADDAGWRDRNDRDRDDRGLDDGGLDDRDIDDRDVNDGEVNDHAWGDGDQDDRHRNADAPLDYAALDYAPWADEYDPPPLPPGWRGR